MTCGGGAVWLVMAVFICETQWNGERGREREMKEWEINKILGCKATVTVYIYMVTVAKM